MPETLGNNQATIVWAAADLIHDLVNFDNFAAQYDQATATNATHLYIRHKDEKKLSRGKVMRHHAIDLTQDVFPDATNLQGIERQAYLVIRHPKDEDQATIKNLVTALADFASDATILAKIVNGQSL